MHIPADKTVANGMPLNHPSKTSEEVIHGKSTHLN
jgi:hypothetical protein